MEDVQIGHSVNAGVANVNTLVRPWVYPLKFEESSSWSMADAFVAKTFVVSTYHNDRAYVTLPDLVKRLEETSHIKEEYLLESIPRLLRRPPYGSRKIIAGVMLRPK